MRSHAEIQALLAEWLSSKMDPEQRRLVQAHLAGCEECSELVSDLEALKREIQKAGEAMFEPHPEPGELRRFALGDKGDAGAPIGRHLVLCPACRLEVEAWKRMAHTPSLGSVAPRSVAPVVPPLWIGLSAAAGIILGCLGTLLIAPSGAPRKSPLPSQAPSAPGVGFSTSMSQPVMHFLPGLARDHEVPTQQWLLDSAEPFLSVAVPLTLPASAPDSERIRFEISRTGQEPIWSTEMTASRIREHLEASEMVNLVVVLSRPPEAGPYEFRVVSSDSRDQAPLYRAEIELSYRQSPAATSAPQ